MTKIESLLKDERIFYPPRRGKIWLTLKVVISMIRFTIIPSRILMVSGLREPRSLLPGSDTGIEPATGTLTKLRSDFLKVENLMPPIIVLTDTF